MINAVAAVSMLVDHIGFIFFPELPVLRVVGRIAMPRF